MHTYMWGLLMVKMVDCLLATFQHPPKGVFDSAGTTTERSRQLLLRIAFARLVPFPPYTVDDASAGQVAHMSS